jgi:AAA15 family ATPase/GTPase
MDHNFKLIGIRPHKNCGEKFLKVLEPGRLYQFYNEYEFYTKDGEFDGVNGEITHFDFKKTVPDDLYKVGNLNVNISAVVGKNGSGKSTLIELLLYAIYIIGFTSQFIVV